MTHSLKKLKDSELQLIVELDHDELLQFVVETEKQLANELRMEGFRQGKAPRDVIRQRVGEDAIRKEALQTALQSSLVDVISQEKLDVLEQKDLKVIKNEKDSFVYSVILSIVPVCELGDYIGLTVAKKAVSVSVDEIQKILKDVQKSRTTLREVERPAIQGDRVEVDFNLTNNGQAVEGGQSQNHPFVLGEHTFIKGFEEQIISMAKGENKQFVLTVPSDYYQPAIAGKTLDCSVILNKVEEQTLPELTDAFVASLSRFKNLKDLEASIEEGLLLEKQNKEQERVQLELLTKISKTTAVEIPVMLVKQQLDVMIQNFDEQLHGMNMELALYLAQIKKTQDDLRKEWQQRAQEQVKLQLVVRAIARKEQIQVSEEEIMAQMQQMLQQYALEQPQTQDALKNLDIDSLKVRLKSNLLTEKVMAFLETHNTYVTTNS